MESNQGFEQDIASIHRLMDRSVKFISFSGLAGIIAGVYALAGATVAYFLLNPRTPMHYTSGDLIRSGVMSQLVIIAVVVLVASLVTGFAVTYLKAKRLGVTFLDEAGRRMLVNLAIPLVSGGIFILLLLASDHYGIIASCCLLFYGLALVNASPNLYDEVRYLGYCEIVLGLVAAATPGYGLFLWAFGFGVLHILYGAILYRKYEK